MKENQLTLNALSEILDLNLFYSISFTEYQINLQGYYCHSLVSIIRDICNRHISPNNKELITEKISDSGYVIIEADNIRFSLTGVK